jgi:hypothetical protein
MKMNLFTGTLPFDDIATAFSFIMPQKKLIMTQAKTASLPKMK